MTQAATVQSRFKALTFQFILITEHSKATIPLWFNIIVIISLLFIILCNFGLYLEWTRGHQGPVVQSIVSITNSLRVQLVKCFTTLLPNTLIFFDEKIREAFALQKLLTFLQ